MPITYSDLYLDIRRQLKASGIEAATLEARELVCFGSGKTREELFRAIGSKNIVLGDADLNVLHDKTPGTKSSGGWTHFIPFLKKKTTGGKNKKETWQLAFDLGGQPLVDLIVQETHTCYIGTHDELHEWGYGCGQCPACLLRKRGFAQYCAEKQAS